MSSVDETLAKDITEMKISDLYKYALENNIANGRAASPNISALDNLAIELANTKKDLVAARKELINSTKFITGLSKDLSKNGDDLQQSRIEVQQSRLENQQTRLELLNFKNDSKLIIESLNNKLDELLRVNESNTSNFYQNIVNHLDEHFSNGNKIGSEGSPNKRRKVVAEGGGVDERAEEEDEVSEEEEQEEKEEEEDEEEEEEREEEEEEEEGEEEDEQKEKEEEGYSRDDMEVEKQEPEREEQASPASSETSAASVSKKPQKEAMYRLVRGADSINLIWEEYIRGVNGGPSVKFLEEKYAYRWRDDKERSILGHRRRIYSMIEKAIENGKSEKEAVDFLDNYLVNEFGEKRSFAWLFDNIPEGYR